MTTPEADIMHSVMDIADDALHETLHAISATLLTGDVRPITETAAWIADLIRSRNGDEMMLSELASVPGVALRE